MSAPYPLDKDFRIFAIDERNWSLQERKMRTPEDGGEKYEAWQDVGYFGSVQGVCAYWAQKVVRRSEKPLPVALAEAIKALDKVLKDIGKATRAL